MSETSNSDFVRINPVVMGRFRKHCMSEGLIMAGVVSRIVQAYLNNPRSLASVQPSKGKKKTNGKKKRSGSASKRKSKPASDNPTT